MTSNTTWQHAGVAVAHRGRCAIYSMPDDDGDVPMQMAVRLACRTCGAPQYVKARWHGAQEARTRLHTVLGQEPMSKHLRAELRAIVHAWDLLVYDLSD